MGIQQGGYIKGYQEGGMSDDDYQAQMLNKAGLGNDDSPWIGNVPSVESSFLSPTRDEYTSDSFETREGAPQGTWRHLSERNGEVEDFIQPMMPTVNVRGTR